MTRVEITYRMSRGEYDGAENAIVIPMTDANADDVLLMQERSRLVGDSRRKGTIATLLDRLAKLQGYGWAEFRLARAVGYTKEEEI